MGEKAVIRPREARLTMGRAVLIRRYGFGDGHLHLVGFCCSECEVICTWSSIWCLANPSLFKPCGLLNLGNTCYMNASIQSLAAISEISPMCKERGAKQPLPPLVQSIGELLNQMSDTSLSSTIPGTVLQVGHYLYFAVCILTNFIPSGTSWGALTMRMCKYSNHTYICTLPARSIWNRSCTAAFLTLRNVTTMEHFHSRMPRSAGLWSLGSCHQVLRVYLAYSQESWRQRKLKDIIIYRAIHLESRWRC